MSDPYVYPQTEVLVNKFDIQDAEKLQDLESIAYLRRLSEPLPTGKFDYDHLKSIHKHLFGDVYEWAGEERSVDIIKGNSHFARKEYIQPELNKAFKKLQTDNYLQNLNPPDFCKKLSFYFNEINAAHPFREGNGRALRAFTDLLADQAGYSLNWELVPRQEFMQANIAGFNAVYEPMEAVFRKIVTPKLQLTQDRKDELVTLSPDLKDALAGYLEAKTDYDQKTAQYFTSQSPDKPNAKQAMTEAEQNLKPRVEQLLKLPAYQNLMKSQGFQLDKSRQEELLQAVKTGTLTRSQLFRLSSLVESNAANLDLGKSESNSIGRGIKI